MGIGKGTLAEQGPEFPSAKNAFLSPSSAVKLKKRDKSEVCFSQNNLATWEGSASRVALPTRVSAKGSDVEEPETFLLPENGSAPSA